MSVAMGSLSVEQALTPDHAPGARAGRLAYDMGGPSTTSSPRRGNAPAALGPCSSRQSGTGRDAPDLKSEGSTPSHPDFKTTGQPDPVSERTYRRPRKDGRRSRQLKVGLAIRSVSTRVSAAGRVPTGGQTFDSLGMGTDCRIRAVVAADEEDLDVDGSRVFHAQVVHAVTSAATPLHPQTDRFDFGAGLMRRTA